MVGLLGSRSRALTNFARAFARSPRTAVSSASVALPTPPLLGTNATIAGRGLASAERGSLWLVRDTMFRISCGAFCRDAQSALPPRTSRVGLA